MIKPLHTGLVTSSIVAIKMKYIYLCIKIAVKFHYFRDISGCLLLSCRDSAHVLINQI